VIGEVTMRLSPKMCQRDLVALSLIVRPAPRLPKAHLARSGWGR